MILVHLFEVSKSVDEVSTHLVLLAEQRASPYYRAISYLRDDPFISPIAEVVRMAGGIVEVHFYRDDATVIKQADHLDIMCYRLRSTGEPVDGCVLSATLHPLLDGTYIEFACYDDDYRPEYKRMLGMLGQSLPENQDSPDPEEPDPGDPNPEEPDPEDPEPPQEIITTEYTVASHPPPDTPDSDSTPTSPIPIDETTGMRLGASSPLTFRQVNDLALLAEQAARSALLMQSSLVHLAKQAAEIASIAQNAAGLVPPLAHLMDVMLFQQTSVAKMGYLTYPLTRLLMDFPQQTSVAIPSRIIAPLGIPSAEAVGTPGLIALPPIKGEGHGLLDLAVSATGTVENHIAVADAVHIQEAVNLIIAHGATFDDAEAIVSMFNFTVWLQRFDQRSEERLTRFDQRSEERLTRLEARMDQLLPQQPSDQYVRGALRKHIEKIAANQTLDAYRRLCEIHIILEAEGLTMPASELARLLGITDVSVRTYLKRIRQNTENFH